MARATRGGVGRDGAMQHDPGMSIHQAALPIRLQQMSRYRKDDVSDLHDYIQYPYACCPAVKTENTFLMLSKSQFSRRLAAQKVPIPH